MEAELEDIKDVNPKTGIGKDYLKTFGPLNLYLRSVYGTSTTTRIQKFATVNASTHRFRKYEEWFPSNEFKDVLTEKNRPYVQRLDQIVDELTELQRNGRINDALEGRSLPLFNEAMRIILGRDDFVYKAICQQGEDKINEFFWN